MAQNVEGMQNVRPPWHHKYLSRMKAEELLMKTGVRGAYLVRESESLVNTKVLSILTKDEVQHFKIVKSQDGRYSLETAKGVQEQFFESLDHLISFYEVQREQLPVPLKLAVAEEGTSISSEPDSYDSDDGDISDDQNSESNVRKFFLQQMAILKGKSADNDFEEVLESYIRNGLTHDLHKVEMGATKPPHFNKVVVGELQRSLDAFTKKLDFVLNLFDVGENDTTKLRSRSSGMANSVSSQAKGAPAYSADFEGIVNQLKICKSRIVAIEKKSFQVLKDYGAKGQQHAIMEQQETYQVVPSDKEQKKKESRHRQGICQFFSAYKANSKNKMCISVNMKEGKVAFLKNQEDYQGTSNTVDHSSIAQLLKDKSSKTSLGITIGKKITTYNFEDFKSRELFCHMVERMKHMYSDNSNKGRLTQINVFVGTWNMGNAHPPDNMSSWLKCQGNGKEKVADDDSYSNAYDIVAIGTQESGIHEKEWIARIKDVLKKIYCIDYTLIAKGSLWDIKLMIFVKPIHSDKITTVKQSVVKTGIANTLGNKGAVGISFYFGNTSFCFVNAHQQARLERVLKRNQNFHDILRGLNLGQQGVFDIANNFHHLFWFGDLNYRVHTLEIEAVLKHIMVKDLDSLLKFDQLSGEKALGNAFFGFEEEQITFRPTYRYKAGSHHMYIWLKKKPGANVTNVPSWPDRVLWKSFPEVFIANNAYGSTEDIVTSDHAPVFAAFEVGLLSQSKDLGYSAIKSTQNAVIEFLHVEAKIRTSCKTRFILFFCSTCLEVQTDSKTNSISDWRNKKDSKKEDFLHSYPAWRNDDIPKLLPALSNQSYLEDQHIQIAVKGEDGHESYGECVLSVKRLLRGGTEEISSSLTHLGDESGEIRVLATVDLPNRKKDNPVIKNVSDLNSFDDSGENDSGFASKDSVDLDSGLVGVRRRRMTVESANRNYELVGNFSNENDKCPEATFNPGDFSFPRRSTVDDQAEATAAPPVPPKKRLSKQLSGPAFSTAAHSDSTSAIIWIDDPRSLNRSMNLPSKADADLPPPPVPKRQSTFHDSRPSYQEESASIPMPKPRSLKSLKKQHPETVEEWLQRLNLMQYHDQLICAGWDDLDYLDFTHHDLEDAGIVNRGHRELLLKSAEVLRSQKRSAHS